MLGSMNVAGVCVCVCVCVHVRSSVCYGQEYVRVCMS